MAKKDNIRNKEVIDETGYKLPTISGKEIRVEVRDVGQGNCNEIYIDGNLKYVYDFGTNIYATKEEVDNLINEVYSIYEEAKPILILSHWDLDHYHLLKGLEAKNKNPFSAFVFIGELPNKTSQDVYEFMNEKLVKEVYSITPRRMKGVPNLTTLTSNAVLTIYSPDGRSSRNNSELVCVAHRRDTDIILSGDSYYEQIHNAILSNSVKNINLVLPHHGGRAGDVSVVNTKNIKNVAISVGKDNNYGHPYPSVTAHFNKCKVKETSNVGQITL